MKKLIVFGCSNAAGFEIYGGMDTKQNRMSSFGNLLGKKLDREVVNAGFGGASNSAIARTISRWIKNEYTEDTDIHILIAWTESCRVEYPRIPGVDYRSGNPWADYWLAENDNFIQINMGLDPDIDYAGTEKVLIEHWQNYTAAYAMTTQMEYLNLVLQTQYLLELKGINYTMCNTMHTLEPKSYELLESYMDLVDEEHYLDFRKPENNFYWYYRNNGYVNDKALYWHHGIEPHTLYADRLFDFIKHRHIG